MAAPDPSPADAARLLEDGWDELGAALDAARDAGALGRRERDAWSAADLAVHVAGWERLALELIEDVRAGVPPRLHAVLSGPDAVDRYNAQELRRAEGLEPSEAVARADTTHRALIAALRALSAEEWRTPVADEPGGGARPLGRQVGRLLGAPRRAFGHVSAHRDDIARILSAAGR